MSTNTGVTGNIIPVFSNFNSEEPPTKQNNFMFKVTFVLELNGIQHRIGGKWESCQHIQRDDIVEYDAKYADFDQIFDATAIRFFKDQKYILQGFAVFRRSFRHDQLTILLKPIN
jgi:hypothetical protein